MALSWIFKKKGTCIRTCMIILIAMLVLRNIFTQKATLADIWCQELVLLEDQLKTSPPNNDSARSRAYEIGTHLHRIMSENLTEIRCRDVVSAGIRRLENAIPLVFVITATFKRYAQKVELVRFSRVLRQVPNILWIVVEDGENKTTTITEFLANSGVPHVYLSVAGTKQHNVKPKGVRPQNRGLQYVRESLKVNPRPSVIYIADDDNTYTLKLFKEMRYIRKIGVWPVGFAGGLPYESPVVVNGKVRDWFSAYQRTRRKFPIDMAGFAITGELLMTHPNAKFGFHLGSVETKFIESLGVTVDDLEPRADNCTKILVWHTQTSVVIAESTPNRTEEILKSIKHENNITYKVIFTEV